MVTQEELEEEINKILKNASLKDTTTKKVIQKLEKIFDTDLSDKKKLIDKLVMAYVDSLESSDDNMDEDEEDNEEEEEDERKSPPPKKEDEEWGGTKLRAKGPFGKPFIGELKFVELTENKGCSGIAFCRGREIRSTVKKKKGKKPAAKKEKKTPAKKKGGGVAKKGGKGSGYTRAIKLSPELSELVGATELPRHEVVKRVWAIIKERQLFDPNNKQFAICDKPLYKVIGTQRFYTFGMMKYLKHHFIDD